MKRLVFLLLLATPLFAETVQWTNGRWFDGRTFVRDTFYSVDGVLTHRKPKKIDRVVDLGDKFVVPPFGDAHHHGIDGEQDLDAKIKAFLDAGIFYVKNPNVIPMLLTDVVRQKVNTLTSIDVAFANGGLTAPQGHPVKLHDMLAKRNVFAGLKPEDMDNRAYFTIASEEDLAKKWSLILEGRPDFLKTFVLFSGTERSEGLSPQMLSAIVKRAHAAKLRVSSHVETANDFRVALNADVDEINHLPIPRGADLSPYVIDEATAKLAAKKNVVVIPTVHVMARFSRGANLDKERANQIANVQQLEKAGVRLAIGSDGISGEKPMATALDEVTYMQKYGFASNLSLLKMWSETTAQTIFPHRKIGFLEDGYEANFLVLDGNPIEDFSNVRKIAMRVKQGKEL